MELDGYVDIETIFKNDIEYIRDLHTLLSTKQVLSRNHPSIQALGRIIKYLDNLAGLDRSEDYKLYNDIATVRTLISTLRDSNVSNLHNTEEISNILNIIVDIIENQQKLNSYIAGDSNIGSTQ